MSVFVLADTARDTDRAIERMATALPSAVLLCLLLHSSRASDINDRSRTAFVHWSSFTSKNTSNTITAVTISNGTETLHVREKGFLSVPLPEENGPHSYWRVTADCIMNVTLNDTYLFIDATATRDLYYSLSFYGGCGPNDIPNLFIQVFDEETPSDPHLGIDEALLAVTNNLSFPVTISQSSNNCYKCKPYLLGKVIPGQLWNVTLDTSFGWKIYVTYFTDNDTTNTTLLCTQYRQFTEHSRYTLNLVEGQCHLEHGNMVFSYVQYLPILYAGVAILGVALLWGVVKIVGWLMRDRGYLHSLHLTRVDRVTARDLGNPRKGYGTASPQETEPLNQQRNSSLNNGALGTPDQAAHGDKTKPTAKKRLASLDAFRGFSLMIMIFVNYGGGGYWFFNHSRWNGLTVADLVFPWFVWIMGVSIVFSYQGRRKDSLWSRVYQLLRRTVILFGLGLFLNNGFTLSHWRIPGVLQRFAISYFVVALTELITAELQRANLFTPTVRFLLPFRDVTANVIHWIMIALLEFLWLTITFLLPVPHCPTGYLGPGGLSDDGRHYNCTGGAAGAIDHWLFGYNHIYQTPTAKETYKLLLPYDPEGALGSLNSIVICLLGVQAGRTLTSYKKHYNILIRFIIWGITLGCLALVLCEGQKNDGFIPINKNLWSLSFILAMAGSGFILLAIFYFTIDVILWWNGAPFKYPGMNSILVYVGSEILQGYFPFSWQQQSNSHLDLLFANLIAVSLWIAIAYYWFKINFFVKI